MQPQEAKDAIKAAYFWEKLRTVALLCASFAMVLMVVTGILVARLVLDVRDENTCRAQGAGEFTIKAADVSMLTLLAIRDAARDGLDSDEVGLRLQGIDELEEQYDEAKAERADLVDLCD